MTALAGQPLRYLIARDSDAGVTGMVTVIGYGADSLPVGGAGYINCRVENGGRRDGILYIDPPDDIEREYGEPAIVFTTLSFWDNFDPQVAKWKRLGAPAVEIDNLDTYDVAAALKMFDQVAKASMGVLVKNAAIVDGDQKALLAHPAAAMVIVERDCGTAAAYEALRRAAGKPDMPIRFVAYGDGRQWAQQVAQQIKAAGYADMAVTYSPDGEYGSVEHILLPTNPTKNITGNIPMTLVQKIVAAAERRGATLDRGPGEINIVYVEGMDADGSPNRNRVNAFDDLRCVIDFVNGEPRILGSWEATTAPGEQYTENPINDDGAAIIALGYQRAWQVGMHRGDHLALIQTGGEVRVARDKNKDYAREGDVVQAGWFGINQHWGYNQPKDDIGPASAGCMVGRAKDGHRTFMKLVQADPRYLADSKFIFGTTVVTAKDVIGDAIPATVGQTGYRSLIGGYFASPSQTDLPASIRYNNPGAVNAVAWNKALPGYAGNQNLDGTNTIAIYYTPEQGVAMWWELLRKYASGGATTVGAIIDRYGGGQNYSAYKSFVVDKTGLAADTEIDLDDDEQLLPFAKAMFWYEAGRSTPLSDAQILYGFAYARNGFKPPAAEPAEPAEPVPSPVEGNEPPVVIPPTSKPATTEEAFARVEAALADLKETIRMAQQPVQQQIDWGALLAPLAKELLPKLLPTLLPYIIQLLPQLLPLILNGMSQQQKPAVSGTTVGAAGAGVGIGGLIGALLTAFFSGKVPQ